MTESRESRARALKLRVGIFMVVALVAFLGMIYLLGARARLFESRYTIHADFTEVGGLIEGATVRLAGVQIGRVTGVNLPGQPGGKVRIDMSITKKYADRIRQNSVARIDTQGLLGDKIVEITVGTADAPPVQAGAVLAARDPTDIGQVMNEGAATVKNVAALAEGLKTMTETLNKSGIVEDATAALRTTRNAAEQGGQMIAEARKVTGQIGRLVDQVEKGKGWAHVLLYEEPVALRRVNDTVTSLQATLDRIERGEGALGVLTSKDSTAAAKKLVAAIDRLGGAIGDQDRANDGLLPALLLDPKYKAVLDDLREVTKNFRDVSDRIAGGKGTIGALVKDEPGDGSIREASRDLQSALANLKEITAKLNEGEGTLGALIADPTLYERLVSILEGAQRSFLLRGLLRGLGNRGATERERSGENSKERSGR
jgi:phospholipid/cholesterol/gamma-HCH transport system substrate-binding protein